MTDQQLLKIKKEIEYAKENVSKLKGRLAALYEQLEQTWGCKTLEKAEKKLASIKSNWEKNSKELNELIEELEEKYAEL